MSTQVDEAGKICHVQIIDHSPASEKRRVIINQALNQSRQFASSFFLLKEASTALLLCEEQGHNACKQGDIIYAANIAAH